MVWLFLMLVLWWEGVDDCGVLPMIVLVLLVLVGRRYHRCRRRYRKLLLWDLHCIFSNSRRRTFGSRDCWPEEVEGVEEGDTGRREG